MNLILTVLLTVAASIAGLTVWFFTTFTVFRAAEGEGFLVLYDKEAAECAASECAVYSEREFEKTVHGILRNMLRRQQSQRDGMS